MFHKNEDRHKIWRGFNLSFQYWDKKFDKFWPEHSKVSKTLVLMDSFWAKYTFFEVKKYRGVIFHETEERYKICRWIDSWFQIDIRNLQKFDLSSRKSGKFSF